MKTFLLATTLGAFLLVPGPARAWDPETHKAIARLALAISPAAEARVQSNHEAFFAAVAEPDPFDKKCTEHPTLPPPRDAATQASQLLDQLLSAKLLPSKEARAHAMGRLVHYAADAAVPEAFLKVREDQYQTFWTDTTFAVFRQSRPISRPWAESIRSIGADAHWGDDSRSMHAYAFRLAVNLVADTLLALPAADLTAGDSKVADAGPVYFGIDRTSAGVQAAAAQNRSLAKKVADIKKHSTAAKQSPAATPPPDLGPGIPPTDRPGVHLVELVTRHAGSRIDVRALLYNNQGTCADALGLTGAAWHAGVPGRIAPLSVRVVEMKVSGPVPVDTLYTTSRSFTCAPPYAADAGISAQGRILLKTDDQAPHVESPLKEAE